MVIPSVQIFREISDSNFGILILVFKVIFYLTIGHNCPNIKFVKAKQLIRKLKKHGVEFIRSRGKGGHQLAKYRGKQTTIPVYGDGDLGPQFVKTLCKQLGINPDDIL